MFELMLQILQFAKLIAIYHENCKGEKQSENENCRVQWSRLVTKKSKVNIKRKNKTSLDIGFLVQHQTHNFDLNIPHVLLLKPYAKNKSA